MARYLTCPTPVHHRGRLCPCGQCPVCLTKKRNGWVTRLQWQSIEAPNNTVFATLTYSDEYLPRSFMGKHPEVDPGHLNKFLRLLRNDIPPFKYYAVGEYGHRTGRPHYHVLFFNLRPYRQCGFPVLPEVGLGCCSSCPIEECAIRYCRSRWDYGISTYDWATPAHIGYICKHHIIGHIAPFKSCAPAFSRMSKGLGAPFLDNPVLPAYHYDHGLVTHTYTPTGALTSFPRYFRDRLFTPAERAGLLDPPSLNPLAIGDSNNFIYEFQRKSFLKDGKV